MKFQNPDLKNVFDWAHAQTHTHTWKSRTKYAPTFLKFGPL